MVNPPAPGGLNCAFWICVVMQVTRSAGRVGVPAGVAEETAPLASICALTMTEPASDGSFASASL